MLLKMRQFLHFQMDASDVKMAQITQDLDKRCKICQDKSYRVTLTTSIIGPALHFCDIVPLSEVALSGVYCTSF